MFPSRLIIADRIGNGLDLSSKKRLLERLGVLFASAVPNLSPEGVFGRLCKREGLSSTELGQRGRLAPCPHVGGNWSRRAFVQLRKGVAFDTPNNGPVDLAFALLVPESVTSLHLQLLAQLASMFKDPRLRQDLRQATSAEQILVLLEDPEPDA